MKKVYKIHYSYPFETKQSCIVVKGICVEDAIRQAEDWVDKNVKEGQKAQIHDIAVVEEVR